MSVVSQLVSQSFYSPKHPPHPFLQPPLYSTPSYTRKLFTQISPLLIVLGTPPWVSISLPLKGLASLPSSWAPTSYLVTELTWDPLGRFSHLIPQPPGPFALIGCFMSQGSVRGVSDQWGENLSEGMAGSWGASSAVPKALDFLSTVLLRYIIHIWHSSPILKYTDDFWYVTLSF